MIRGLDWPIVFALLHHTIHWCVLVIGVRCDGTTVL